MICYCKVTTLAPRHPETRRMLGLAYCVLGQRDKAIELYEEWLKDDPDNPVAQRICWPAAPVGMFRPGASDACVQMIFDSFAASFESKLAHLQYRAPSLVHVMLEAFGPACRPRRSDVLDAGCGTGLCGPLVAPYARRLTGVDLSAGMLEQAKAKQIYDELVQGELTQFLQGRPGAFDLIVSADTLVYFGDLEDVAAAARAALRPGGLFVFTLEELVVDDEGLEIRLEPHGRYTHAQHYVEAGAGGGAVQHRDRARRAQNGIRFARCRTGDSRDRDQWRRPCLEAWRSRRRSATDVLLFHRMHAREELSRSSEFELELLSESTKTINFDEILGKNVTVTDQAAGRLDAVFQRIRHAILGGRPPRPLPSLHRHRVAMGMVHDAHDRLPHLPGDDGP